MQQVLGTGRLSWPRYERISGRYGMIALFRPGDPGQGETGLQGLPYTCDVDALVGKHGSLVATRRGEPFLLGTGTVFVERDFGCVYIGLKPDDPREEDWLDPLMLYKIDGVGLDREPVELTFEETGI